jgi:hypothetical protein
MPKGVVPRPPPILDHTVRDQARDQGFDGIIQHRLTTGERVDMCSVFSLLELVSSKSWTCFWGGGSRKGSGTEESVFSRIFSSEKESAGVRPPHPDLMHFKYHSFRIHWGHHEHYEQAVLPLFHQPHILHISITTVRPRSTFWQRTTHTTEGDIRKPILNSTTSSPRHRMRLGRQGATTWPALCPRLGMVLKLLREWLPASVFS